MNREKCPRCGQGVDTDGDGHCAICAHWTSDYAESRRLLSEKKTKWEAPDKPGALVTVWGDYKHTKGPLVTDVRFLRWGLEAEPNAEQSSISVAILVDKLGHVMTFEAWRIQFKVGGEQ